MTKRTNVVLCSVLLAFTVAAAAEEGALHCRGSRGATCSVESCEAQQIHVDLTLETASPRAALCIGESCYAGALPLTKRNGTLEGDFSGHDARKESFGAHVTLSAERDAAAITWGDGVTVAMVFTRCGEKERQ